MKKLFEKLLQPFVLASLLWIGISVSAPFKTYNRYNYKWPFYGIILITITIFLVVNFILTDRRANKNQNKEK